MSANRGGNVERDPILSVGAAAESIPSRGSRHPPSARGFSAILVDEDDGFLSVSEALQTRSWRVVCGVAAILAITGSVATFAIISHGQRSARLRAAEDVNFSWHAGYDCWMGFGGEPLLGKDPVGAVTFNECRSACRETAGCAAFVFPSSVAEGICMLHRHIDLGRCLRTPALDVWIGTGVAIKTSDRGERGYNPEQEWLKRASRILTLPGYRCERGSRSQRTDTIGECRELCKRDDACGGISYGFASHICHTHAKLSIEECQLHAEWDAWLKPSLAEVAAAAGVDLDIASGTSAPFPTFPPLSPVTYAPVSLEPPLPRLPWRVRTTTRAPASDVSGMPWTSIGFDDDDDERGAYEQAYDADVGAARKYGYYQLVGHNCWPPNASCALGGNDAPLSSAAECGKACNAKAECDGFIYGHSVANFSCWLRQEVDISQCKRQPMQEAPEYDYFMKSMPMGRAAENESSAPLHEFYLYRAVAGSTVSKYPFGQVNLGNMDGVMWYLMNEIVTNYTHGPRCPRRFGISEIRRIKVKTRATPALARLGMNFGARFAFDSGVCAGRCFPGNLCTGPGDCYVHYDQYGFVPGCNNFESEYPFPVDAHSAPGGVWYSLPLEGRCDRDPTGERNCTWSYEDAGSITLEQLEKLSPGDDNYCNGYGTDFWQNQWDPSVMSWRSEVARWVFKNKYPHSPKEIPPPKCDFDKDKWYAEDPWSRQDPWR